MRHYTHNPKWLLMLAPFRALSISAAFLTPFFIEKGLNQTDIMLLQSFFSIVVVLFEVPSGWIADKLGRANCIKWSGPLAATAMIAYAFGNSMLHFLVCEFLMAAANGLISGADDALLMDSLRASYDDPAEVERRYVSIGRRIDGYGFASVAVGLPIAYFVVDRFGVPATLFVDGCITLIGCMVGFRLVESPDWKKSISKQGVRRVWTEFVVDAKAAFQLLAMPKTRWLVALHVAFNAGTYFGFWLSAPYYSAVGIPVKYFALLLAGRSVLKFVLSHRLHGYRVNRRAYWVFVGLCGMSYIGMGLMNVWLVPIVIGHDIIQSLGFTPMMARLNQSFSNERRATMNSAVNMLRRLSFAVLGPFIGLLVDHQGLRTTLIGLGFSFLVLLGILMARIARTKQL